MNILFISLAGAAGVALRYAVGAFVSQSFDTKGLPWATLSINVAGSFAIGAVASLAKNGHLSDELRLILATGFLGGFTTFSALSLESLQLLEQRSVWGLAYPCASVIAGILACKAGLQMGAFLTDSLL